MMAVNAATAAGETAGESCRPGKRGWTPPPACNRLRRHQLLTICLLSLLLHLVGPIGRAMVQAQQSLPGTTDAESEKLAEPVLWRLEPEETLAIELDQVVTSGVIGQGDQKQVRMQCWMTWEVLDLTATGFQIEQTITRIRMTVNSSAEPLIFDTDEAASVEASPAIANLNALVGQPVTGQLSRLGEFRDWSYKKIRSRSRSQAEDISMLLDHLLLRLPLKKDYQEGQGSWQTVLDSGPSDATRTIYTTRVSDDQPDSSQWVLEAQTRIELDETGQQEKRISQGPQRGSVRAVFDLEQGILTDIEADRKFELRSLDTGQVQVTESTSRLTLRKVSE